MQQIDPPTIEEYDLDMLINGEYQPALCDFPPGARQPTEGKRLIDGFAMIHASEEDD